MNNTTKLFNLILQDALNTLTMIPEAKDKVDACTKLLEVLAKTNKVEDITLLSKESADVKTAETVTREDLMNKPNEKEAAKTEVATEQEQPSTTVVNAATNTTTVENKPTQQENVAVKAEELSKDEWNYANVLTHINDYYFVATIISYAAQNSDYANVMSIAVEKATGGAIKSVSNINEIKPSLVKYISSVLRQAIGKTAEAIENNLKPNIEAARTQITAAMANNAKASA